MGKKYLPAHKRVDNPPAMRVTARDVQIVLAVYRYRILSSVQIEHLFFPSPRSRGKRTICQRRLQLLYHNRFLDRELLPLVLGEGRAPFLYTLGRSGFELVVAQIGLAHDQIKYKRNKETLSTLFLQHTLAINDFRIVVEKWCAKHPIRLCKWLEDAYFRHPKRKEIAPQFIRNGKIERRYPDGYFILHVAADAEPTHYFLEVDRGTMELARWKEKIYAYEYFRKSGLSEKHYQTKNFRVLTIVKGAGRCQNLMTITAEVTKRSLYLFATLDQVNLSDPDRLFYKAWKKMGNGALHTLLPEFDKGVSNEFD